MFNLVSSNINILFSNVLNLQKLIILEISFTVRLFIAELGTADTGYIKLETDSKKIKNL